MSGGSSAVGFSFTGDLVGIGQGASFLTGRILKALSDGKVDPYAVLSLVEIGNQLHISTWAQKKIRDCVIAKCQSRSWQSVLIQALKIGWDHSPVAMEMTRTAGGTSALALVEALIESSSNYAAAEIITHFLLISGASRERIPNVDVLRGAIEYLRRFVSYSGFSGAFQAIVASCKENWRRCRGRVGMQDPNLVEEIENNFAHFLQDYGTPEVVAGAMNQLILTCSLEESINFIAKQRVAWLAAFAGHVLGMSVTILFHEIVLWETRTQRGGHATFQMGTFKDSAHALERVGIRIQIIEHADRKLGTMQPSYRLGDLIDVQLAQYPQLSPEQCHSIHCSIAIASCAFYPIREALEQALGWVFPWLSSRR